MQCEKSRRHFTACRRDNKLTKEMFKSILTSILLSAISIASFGQNNTNQGNSNVTSAHQQALQQQLASVKSSKMDRTVVKDLIKEDVAKRESEVVAGVTTENQKLISDLLVEANKHIGKPYRHGMKGPNAFDCSGFTSYVYKQFGFSINPSSRVQYTDGVSVDRKHLRKGDLVFFTSRSSGKNVGHVGIVTSANNETGEFEFIHASLKGVKISSCEGYYANRYVGARRIIE